MTTVLIPGTVDTIHTSVTELLKDKGYASLYLGSVCDADVSKGLAYMDNDLCVTAVASVGQALRFCQAHPELEDFAILAPEICKDCRSISLPVLIPETFVRAGAAAPEVVVVTSDELAACAGAVPPDEPADDRPVIGVFGNPAVLTTPLFRETVVNHLEESGVRAVVAPAQIMLDEREFLEPAIRYFDERGITTTIGVLAFGCLGGHTFARGKLRVLREKYPQVEVTLLDYDPSASDINLVNRTELVIQTAKEKARA